MKHILLTALLTLFTATALAQEVIIPKNWYKKPVGIDLRESIPIGMNIAPESFIAPASMLVQAYRVVKNHNNATFTLHEQGLCTLPINTGLLSRSDISVYDDNFRALEVKVAAHDDNDTTVDLCRNGWIIFELGYILPYYDELLAAPGMRHLTKFAKESGDVSLQNVANYLMQRAASTNVYPERTY